MQATRWLTIAVIAVIASGCVAVQSGAAPAAIGPTRASADAETGGRGDTGTGGQRDTGVEEPVRAEPSQIAIYAPATTSSAPVILAAQQLATHAGTNETADLTIFTNHSQANTLFLRGDVDILVTGLSVGVEFFRNGAPVQAINCNVSGLTYLVTYGRQVNSFA